MEMVEKEISSYPYQIDGEDVEFFHWHVDKSFGPKGDRIKITDIREAINVAHETLGEPEHLIPDMRDWLLHMNNKVNGRRRETYMWPKGFTIGKVGDKIAVSWCSENDNFDPATGRRIVMHRLRNGFVLPLFRPGCAPCGECAMSVGETNRQSGE